MDYLSSLRNYFKRTNLSPKESANQLSFRRTFFSLYVQCVRLQAAKGGELGSPKIGHPHLGSLWKKLKKDFWALLVTLKASDGALAAVFRDFPGFFSVRHLSLSLPCWLVLVVLVTAAGC